MQRCESDMGQQTFGTSAMVKLRQITKENGDSSQAEYEQQAIRRLGLSCVAWPLNKRVVAHRLSRHRPRGSKTFEAVSRIQSPFIPGRRCW